MGGKGGKGEWAEEGEREQQEGKQEEGDRKGEREEERRKTEKETILAILRETMVLYKQIISESQHRDSFLKTPLMYYSCICPLKQRLPTELIFS